jgi:N-acetylneuraminic acid mutarotase
MRSRKLLGFVCCLAAAACGDDEGTRDASATAGSGASASVGSGGGPGAGGTGSGAAGGSSASAGGAGGGAPQGWATLPPLPGGPRQETAVVALGGKVWVIGGFDGAAAVVDAVEVYDPASGTWSDGPALPTPLHHANATVVGDRIWLLGHCRSGSFTAHGDVWSLDPDAGAWVEATPMPVGTARCASAVGALGELVYVAGGLRGGDVADVSVYDTVRDNWTALGDLPGPRDHLAGGVADGTFFAVGGRSGGIEGLLGEVLAYDVAGDSWAAREPMITPRGGAAAAVVGTRLFVIGGEGNTGAPSGVFPVNEAYDAATDSWAAHPPMPAPRHGTGAATVGGTIYVPGGADQQAFGAVATVESYTP